MKFFNLIATTEEDGSKTLAIDVFGVIEPGFFDDGGVKSADIAAQLLEHKDAKKINVRINSLGGDAFGGVAIYNLLREHPAAQAGNLTSIVEGIAASAASIIAMAGKTVMGRGSMMMIHSPWTFAMGDAASLRKTADVLDSVRDSLLAIYKAKTGKKPAELKALLEAETWMSAEEAKRNGFADELADAPVKAKAEGESVILNSIPFPRASLPAPILAMVVEPPKPAPIVETPAPRSKETGDETVLLLNPAPKGAGEIGAARAIIAAEAPELLAALLAEGHDAGVAEENARVKAILDLGVRGHGPLVSAALFGESRTSAEQLAVAVLRADQQVGADRLAAARAESGVVAGVKPVSPEETDKINQRKRDEEAIKQIAAGINPPRGGVR